MLNDYYGSQIGSHSKCRASRRIGITCFKPSSNKIDVSGSSWQAAALPHAPHLTPNSQWIVRLMPRCYDLRTLSIHSTLSSLTSLSRLCVEPQASHAERKILSINLNPETIECSFLDEFKIARTHRTRPQDSCLVYTVRSRSHNSS